MRKNIMHIFLPIIIFSPLGWIYSVGVKQLQPKVSFIIKYNMIIKKYIIIRYNYIFQSSIRMNSINRFYHLRKCINFTKYNFSNQGKVQYFDYQATTPIDYRVMDAMIPYLTEHYGNPHSKTHQFGWDSSKAIEKARQQVASLINADPKQIIFTSGATESNNMFLKGLAKFYGKQRKHIITTQIEHKCILDTCRYLQLQEGYKVTYLPVQKNGILDIQLLKKTIQQSKERILCVSTILVHNQIGVRQNIQEIGQFCRDKKIFFHTDAAQAVGKIQVDVNKMNIDLMSISGHKLYGPKGIGALYMRRKPRVKLSALINGGGQERGLRSGTLPTPLVVGFGKACQVAKKQMKNDAKHVERLYKKIISTIRERMTHVELNGDENQRYFGNINMSFAYVEGESLLMAMKNYAVSSGSACTSQSLQPSYILRALGVSQELAHTSMRIGIGRFTSDQQVDAFLLALQKSVVRLRQLSPLWQMANQGIDLKTINWAQPH